MSEKVSHIIGNMGSSGGGSAGGVTLSQVKDLIKAHDDNITAHSKLKHKETISTPSKVWTIQHNLNCHWSELTIIPISTDNKVMVGEIDTVNSTNMLVIIEFNEPISGEVTVKL